MLLLAALITGTALAGCGTPRQSPPEAARPSAKPAVKAGQPKPANPKQQAAKGVPNVPDLTPKLVVTQKGLTLRWEANGKTSMSAKASKFEGDQITRIGVLLDFSAQLYDNGKLTATMTAPKVVADTANRTLTATGGVTLTSIDKSTVIKAEWMKWFPKQNKVVGNGGVKVTSSMGTKDRYVMEGAAFEADTKLQSLKVKDSAKGFVYK